MPRTSVRRRIIVAIGTSTVAVIATLTVAVSPAHADTSGYLLTKGTGSIYSKNNGVNLGAIPGGTAKTFYYKIVNTTATAEQFKVNLSMLGPGFTATLYQGYKAVPDEYFTNAIAPGKTLALKVKIAVNAGAPPSEYIAQLRLKDAVTDAVLDEAFADANATNQTGTTQHDLFLKTGGQPYVGGSVTQFETANALRVGRTATFTVRLKNDGAAPAAISLQGDPAIFCPSSFSVTVKQGSQNVTAAVQAGSYTTGTLAPGAKKDLRVTIKLVAPTCGDDSDYFFFSATGPDGNVGSAAHVIIGV
jgi:hypothetical protein